MHRARLTRPSCLIFILLFAIGIAIIGWIVFGDPLRTPGPTSVPKETQTYDTDVPSGSGAR